MPSVANSVVLNFVFRSFGFVSNFDIRISDFTFFISVSSVANFVVLNFVFCSFEFVSNFVLRISDFLMLEVPLTCKHHRNAMLIRGSDYLIVLL